MPSLEEAHARFGLGSLAICAKTKENFRIIGYHYDVNDIDIIGNCGTTHEVGQRPRVDLRYLYYQNKRLFVPQSGEHRYWAKSLAKMDDIFRRAELDFTRQMERNGWVDEEDFDDLGPYGVGRPFTETNARILRLERRAAAPFPRLRRVGHMRFD